MEVFISYARSSQALAESLQQALEEQGYCVWRDDQLTLHRVYSREIQERLDDAEAVLVVWSADAANSEWVLSEANRARQQHKLVQVRSDPTSLPMPFDQIQCLDLSSWKLGDDGANWRRLLASLRHFAGTEAHAPELSTSLRSAEASSGVYTAAGNLPQAVGRVIGRQADVAAILEALEAARLVTVVGPGGVGKTCVAIEVARCEVGAFENGVWLAEMASISEAARAPEQIAKAMNLDLPAGRDPVKELVERLRRRNCFLLVDNCEHLIQGAAELVEQILAQAPGVRVLATSQEPLSVAGERVYALRPLARAEAAQLFCERVQAVDPDFQPGPTEMAEIVSICRRLDGVPLAIEMAAARAPALGCSTVLQHLDDRFRLLTGARRTASARQRTLLGALEWSHGLLDARDATIFRRLAVFAGSFPLAAAVSVAGDETSDPVAVAEALSSLVTKSLVTARPAADSVRFMLLETTRAYALERLTAAGEFDSLRRRHAEWYADYTQPFRSEYTGQTSDDELLARHAPERENVLRALDWAFEAGGDSELGLRLLANSTPVLSDHSLMERYQSVFQLIGPSTPPEIRARLVQSRAHVTALLRSHAALTLVDEAIEAVRVDVGDPVMLCDAMADKVAALWSVGRAEEARPTAREMQALMADQPASRIKAYQMGLEARFVAREDGPIAARAIYDEAALSLRAFGARGDAQHWEMMSLRIAPPADPDVEIEHWRRALARIQPTDMHAEPLTLGAAKDLARRLARRGRPADLKEALELGRLVAKAGPPNTDRFFLLVMAMASARADRPGAAAALAAHIGDFDPSRHSAHAQADLAEIRRLASERLGAARFARIAEVGRQMSRGEAVRLALGEASSVGGLVIE